VETVAKLTESLQAARAALNEARSNASRAILERDQILIDAEKSRGEATQKVRAGHQHACVCGCVPPSDGWCTMVCCGVWWEGEEGSDGGWDAGRVPLWDLEHALRCLLLAVRLRRACKLGPSPQPTRHAHSERYGRIERCWDAVCGRAQISQQRRELEEATKAAQKHWQALQAGESSAAKERLSLEHRVRKPPSLTEHCACCPRTPVWILNQPRWTRFDAEGLGSECWMRISDLARTMHGTVV
jgi:hypothetical protein